MTAHRFWKAMQLYTYIMSLTKSDAKNLPFTSPALAHSVHSVTKGDISTLAWLLVQDAEEGKVQSLPSQALV